MEAATNLDSQQVSPAGHVLLIERRFAAPPALVWRLWQDRDHMRRWWGPKGAECIGMEWDFRPGGAWRAGFVCKTHGENWARGRFRDIAPGRRIAFTFAWENESGLGAESLITVEIEPDGDGALMRFHQAPFATIESRDNHLRGWTEFVDKAQAYAEALAGEAAR